jgi:flavin-binding protein dodecin
MKEAPELAGSFFLFPARISSTPATGGLRMSVEKSIDLTATGSSIEEAVASAVHRASLTLKGLTTFEVERIDGLIENGEVVYRVLVRVSFQIKEQVHE